MLPAEEGAEVALTYVHSKDTADDVVRRIESLNRQALAIQADAEDPGAVVAAVDAAASAFSGLNVLVNNAGIMVTGTIDQVSVSDVDRLLAVHVHVRAVIVATQAALRHMPDGSRIISIGSNLAERVPWVGMSVYAASKAALSGLTRGLARDLGPRGITAVVVQPGATDTDMNPADGADGRAPGRRRRAPPHRHDHHHRRRRQLLRPLKCS
jgi:3-oxoacyl-[acyl-carrier protein] reductase